MLYRVLYALVLRRIPPEAAHTLASAALRAVVATHVVGGWLNRRGPTDPRLRVQALGVTFPSPLGAAAGIDKEANLGDALGALGFGFVEVGAITSLPQEGNPRPRVWRLPKARALVNSMGFPNPGARVAAARLQAYTGETVIGANVGRHKDADDAASDYRATVREIAPACAFLVLNVSSPNTPGLRELQALEPLARLVDGVRAELAELGLAVPVLIKLAPDLADAEIEAIAELALERGVDGIVAVNTSVELNHEVARAHGAECHPGGLSGAPLRPRALDVLALLRAKVGDRVVLVSVGGLETAEDAWERICAGATLVQAYTGFVYGGPGWPKRINDGLLRCMEAAGMPSVTAAIGMAVPETGRATSSGAERRPT